VALGSSYMAPESQLKSPQELMGVDLRETGKDISATQ
jgi:hypothetical protein